MFTVFVFTDAGGFDMARPNDVEEVAVPNACQ